MTINIFVRLEDYHTCQNHIAQYKILVSACRYESVSLETNEILLFWPEEPQVCRAPADAALNRRGQDHQ